MSNFCCQLLLFIYVGKTSNQISDGSREHKTITWSFPAFSYELMGAIYQWLHQIGKYFSLALLDDRTRVWQNSAWKIYIHMPD